MAVFGDISGININFVIPMLPCTWCADASVKHMARAGFETGFRASVHAQQTRSARSMQKAIIIRIILRI